MVDECMNFLRNNSLEGNEYLIPLVPLDLKIYHQIILLLTAERLSERRTNENELREVFHHDDG